MVSKTALSVISSSSDGNLLIIIHPNLSLSNLNDPILSHPDLSYSLLAYCMRSLVPCSVDLTSSTTTSSLVVPDSPPHPPTPAKTGTTSTNANIGKSEEAQAQTQKLLSLVLSRIKISILAGGLMTLAPLVTSCWCRAGQHGTAGRHGKARQSHSSPRYH